MSEEEEMYNSINRHFEHYTPGRKSFVDNSLSERLMSNDKIWYTLVTQNITEDRISIIAFPDMLNITFSDDKEYEYYLHTPYLIESENISYTYRNGILDIECTIVKED